jgi:hypothetical protein
LSQVKAVSSFAGLHAARRRRALERRVAVWLVAFLGSVAIGLPATAQQSRPEEYQVKAVYLFNFGKFVVWPNPSTAAPQASFNVCVLGRDPFGGVLDATLAGEAINNRNLSAKRIASAHEAATCQILFISSSETPRIKEILAAVQGSPMLTVSDMPGFTGNGGMIQFVLKENKVRFEVNLTAAEKAGLMLSSQLLKVATDIRREPPGGSVKP